MSIDFAGFAIRFLLKLLVSFVYFVSSDNDDNDGGFKFILTLPKFGIIVATTIFSRLLSLSTLIRFDVTSG